MIQMHLGTHKVWTYFFEIPEISSVILGKSFRASANLALKADLHFILLGRATTSEQLTALQVPLYNSMQFHAWVLCIVKSCIQINLLCFCISNFPTLVKLEHPSHYSVPICLVGSSPEDPGAHSVRMFTPLF